LQVHGGRPHGVGVLPPAATSEMKRLYTSVEFMSLYSTVMPGYSALKSLISGCVALLSVAP
jgi:hypothetical protein